MTRVVVALLVALSSAQVLAFTCTRAGAAGPSLAWQVRSFEMRAHEGAGAEVSLVEVNDALAHGAAQWTNVDCSDLELVVGEPTAQDRAGFDWAAGRGNAPNENIVVFRNDEDDADQWLHAGAAVAITTVSFELATGEIMDADIELNDVGFTFTACDIDCTPQHDLKNTLTHELGHALGLDHPPSTQPGATEATMFASTNPGDLNKRDLAPDDEDGICTIYPTGQPEGECFGVARTDPSGIRIQETLCGAHGAPTGVAFLIVVLVALGSRKSRASG